MGRKPIVPDEILIKTFIQGKLENKSDSEIARSLGMKQNSLSDRIRKPSISSAIMLQKKTLNTIKTEEIRGISEQSKQIIDIAGKSGIALFKERWESGDKEGAFKVAIELLKVARTDAEIKRVLNIFVDARSQMVNQDIRYEVVWGCSDCPKNIIKKNLEQEEVDVKA